MYWFCSVCTREVEEYSDRLLVMRSRNADYTAAEGFKRNYENSLLRAMMRDAHELILLYCRETGQFLIYEAQPWYQFARLVLTCINQSKGGGAWKDGRQLWSIQTERPLRCAPSQTGR